MDAAVLNQRRTCGVKQLVGARSVRRDGEGCRLPSVDGSQVYAAAGPSLFRSTDGGQTWNELSHDFGTSGISDLAFDPSDAARLYVGSYEQGLLLTTDAANTFTRVGPEPADSIADGPYRIAISANGQAIYYCTRGSKLVSSADGGASFSEQELSSEPRALAISPSSDAALYVATSSGVIKTSNSGANWVSLPQASPFEGWVESIAIVPGTPDQLWISTRENVFSTEDDGEHWTPFAPVLPERKLQHTYCSRRCRRSSNSTSSRARSCTRK